MKLGAAGSQLAAAPRHGTQGLDAFQLQAPDPNRGCTGITVHDTKGQQFFTEDEERYIGLSFLACRCARACLRDYFFAVGNESRMVAV